MEFKEVADHLYTQIAAAVGIDDNQNSDVLQRAYLTFCKPGIPITQRCLNALTDITSYPDYLEDIYTLTNDTSTLERIFNGNVSDNTQVSTDYKLDDFVSNIATNMEVIDYPLSENQKKEADSLQKEIKQKISQKDYLDNIETADSLKMEFAELISEYNIARDKKNRGEILTKEESKLILLYLDKKSKIETKINIATSFIKKWEDDIASLYGKLYGLTAFSFLDEKGNILLPLGKPVSSLGKYTYLVPRDFGTDDGKKSWQNFECNNFNKSIIDKYSSSGGGGSASFLGGLFGISGGGGGSSTTNFNETVINDYKIKANITKVRINRPWFLSNFINEAWWWFDEDNIRDTYYPNYNEWNEKYKGTNGADIPFVGKKGFIMGYSVEAIFVSNLEIKMTHSVNGVTHNVVDGNVDAGFSWGPFRIGGNYYRHNDEKFTTEIKDDGTIKVEGVQLIGFVNKYFPLLPFPKQEKHKGHYKK